MNKPSRLLLLDFQSQAESKSDLARMLESEISPAPQLRWLCFGRTRDGCEAGRLQGILSSFRPTAVLLTVGRGFCSRAKETLAGLRHDWCLLPVLASFDDPQPSDVLALLSAGASDFVLAPYRRPSLVPRLSGLIDEHHQQDEELSALRQRAGLQGMIGQSAVLCVELRKIPEVSRCDVTVLIEGETGTGKELCARAIHYLSLRGSRPYSPLNCGAVPEALPENELFGHESGAYTSATTSSTGLIAQSEGGTLFLDEIDALTLSAQVKLLRLLQEKEYRPLGSRQSRNADVRVIAASNAGLRKRAEEGKFRWDLYYRLSRLVLHLPPLRERDGDIPLLARHFLQKYASEYGKTCRQLAPDAVHRLLAHPWPGNVRELENLIARTVLCTSRQVICACDLQFDSGESPSGPKSFKELKAQTVRDFERKFLTEMLMLYNGNISLAARAARKNRRAFWELMRKHHLTSACPALAPNSLGAA